MQTYYELLFSLASFLMKIIIYDGCMSKLHIYTLFVFVLWVSNFARPISVRDFRDFPASIHVFLTSSANLHHLW